MNNTTLNNTLSSQQNRFRSTIENRKKVKAHKIVPKIAEKSKSISRATNYNVRLERKAKKLSKKARGLSSKRRYTCNPAVAPKKLSKKAKKALSKSMWEST